MPFQTMKMLGGGFYGLMRVQFPICVSVRRGVVKELKGYRVR